jgi:hypothetical protein
LGLGNAIDFELFERTWLVYDALWYGMPWVKIRCFSQDMFICVLEMVVTSVVKHNPRLDSRLVQDALERLAVLLELEQLVDDALCLS